MRDIGWSDRIGGSRVSRSARGILRILIAGQAGCGPMHVRKWTVLGLVIYVACWTASSHATLVAGKKETCPMCQAHIYLSRLTSYGPYIFNEPCKDDLVYAPQSYRNFIATCGKCGYTQTKRDFLSVSENELERLRAADFMRQWQSTSKKVPFPTRLERAVETNQTLRRDGDFWSWFNRVLILHYRELNPGRARSSAKQEIALLKNDKTLPDKQRLYLLGEYSRLAGDVGRTEQHLNKAKATSINRETFLALFAIGCICVVASLVAYVLSEKRRRAAIGTVAMLGGVLAVCCWASAMTQQPNDYYDQIIEDRLILLADSADDQIE